MYSIEMEVRDYELDLQGIVNNSNYQRYLEHARHKFLLSKGVDFAALHQIGMDLVVIRIEMDFKKPLKSGDRFRVDLSVRQEGNLKIVFDQSIVNLNGDVLVLKAVVTGVALSNNKPCKPGEIIQKLLS